MIRREVPDNGPPNSNKKGKDSYHSHSRETKHSLPHGNNQNKTLKGDNLTDSHTRKTTVSKAVNKIDLKESLPTPFPEQLNTHTHNNNNKVPPPPSHFIYIYITLCHTKLQWLLTPFQRDELLGSQNANIQ